MAQFLRSCARPFQFAGLAWTLAAAGCGGDAATPAAGPAPAADPAPAGAQAPDDRDAALERAKRDVETAQRDGGLLQQALTLRIYGTVLRSRQRTDEASQVLLSAVAAACAEWEKDDAGSRAEAGREIDDGCRDMEELINDGLIKKRVTHGQAVAWYGQLHHQVARVGRRAHAAALRHQQAHHATSAQRYDEAAGWAKEAVDERRALGLTLPAAWSLNQLGYIQLLQGKHEQAWTTLGEAAQSVCGRGLNAAARATIQNCAAVIRSHIEAGRDPKQPDPTRTQEGLALLDRLWRTAAGTPGPDGVPAWTAAEQSLVLEHAKELHLLAGDVEGAEQALLAMLWISHRGGIFRPDVDAALWLELATFAHEQAGDPARALRYCDTSWKLHELIGHELGLGWVEVRRGAVRLDQAEAAAEAAAKRQLVEQAVADLRGALKRFEGAGNHRNGRLMAVQYLQRADQLRANPDGAQAWAEQAVRLLAEPPPEPAPVHHFPPVDEMWKAMAAKLGPGAPLVDVVRDRDGWLVTDLVDQTTQRVAWSWRNRVVQVRLFEFHIGGATIRTPVKFGGYAIFVPEGHGAQILRNGLILPAGPKVKGARDFAELKGRFPPPKMRGTAAAGNGGKSK